MPFLGDAVVGPLSWGPPPPGGTSPAAGVHGLSTVPSSAAPPQGVVPQKD